MAVALPVLVLVLFGFFELGHALMVDSIIENAAYEGARQGIVAGAEDKMAKQAARDIAIASSLKSVDVRVQTLHPAARVELISVTVDAPLSKNAICLGSFLGKLKVSRTVTMIRDSSLRFRFMPGWRSLTDPTPRPRGRGKARG
jgi:Flp pilus assembly protein TadG